MMKTPQILCCTAAILFGASTLRTVASPDLVVDSIARTASNDMIATFSDDSSGDVEDFTIQGSPDMQLGSWSDIPSATIQPVSPGKWRAVIPANGIKSREFFRVVKNGVVLTATFSVPTATVREGDEAGITVTFNRPFTGTLRYTVDGTPGSMSLTNATSAVIAVDTGGGLDDDTPGQLRGITLNLELENPAGGVTSYQLGVNASSTLLIEDNDALWGGTMTLLDKGGEFGIRILRTENDGVVTTCFKTDKGGLIPAPPANGSWNFDNFSLDPGTGNFTAAVSGVAIPANATIYGVDTNLAITFSASGASGDVVRKDRIEGSFTISMSVSGRPHLDTQRTGAFSLLRGPDQAGETSAPVN